MKISAKKFVSGIKLRVIAGNYKLSTLPKDWTGQTELEAYDHNLSMADIFKKGTVIHVLPIGFIVETIKLKKEGGQVIYFKTESGEILKSYYGLFRALTEIIL